MALEELDRAKLGTWSSEVVDPRFYEKLARTYEAQNQVLKGRSARLAAADAFVCKKISVALPIATPPSRSP